jgi:CubicO group peptidase (beta-lactamase class C family)
MRHILIASLAAVVAASSVYAQDTTLAARIRRIENGITTPVLVAGQPVHGTTLAERMRQTGTPAVSIAVINRGRIEWARAYGSLQAGGVAPADTATRFQAASISKPVAALGALLMAERGALSLDGDVNDYLRSWRVPESAFTAREKVTLRRIVSHTAGLNVDHFPGYAAGAPVPSTVQVLDGAPPANTPAIRVDTVPGARLRYSGGGPTVMQLMMEDVSGRPFAALMEETVLRPLGMIHSSFDQDVAPQAADHTARAHDRRGAPLAGGWHRYPEMAAAGLWTTPSDLARFLLAVYHAHRGQEGGVISPALGRQMLTRQSGDDGYAFGLGLMVERAGAPGWSFGFGGVNEGFRAQATLFGESGMGVVIMTNSENGFDVGYDLMRAVAREYGWPAWQPEVKTPVAVSPAALADASGRYRVVTGADTVTLAFAVQHGQLVGTGPNWPAPRVLFPLSTTELRFFVREAEREYVFERDDAGRIVRLRIVGRGPELVAQRVE